MTLKRTMKENTVLPEGSYRVRLMDLREDSLENSQYGNGDVIRFVLETTEVVGTDGNPVEIDGIASDKLTPMSKLTRWLGAFGVTTQPGGEIDMGDAVGKEALALVTHKPGKDGTGAFARIDDLMPLPKAGNVRRSIVTNDEVDWTAFWAEVKRLGGTREAIAAKVEGGLVVLPSMAPDEVEALLADLRKAVGE